MVVGLKACQIKVLKCDWKNIMAFSWTIERKAEEFLVIIKTQIQISRQNIIQGFPRIYSLSPSHTGERT